MKIEARQRLMAKLNKPELESIAKKLMKASQSILYECGRPKSDEDEIMGALEEIEDLAKEGLKHF